jgi:regulator of replication initiation timing
MVAFVVFIHLSTNATPVSEATLCFCVDVVYVQVQHLQQEASRADAAAKADAAAATYDAQQLAQHAKQQGQDLAKAVAEVGRLRDTARQLEGQLQTAERNIDRLEGQLSSCEGEVRDAVERADAAEGELEGLRSSSRAQVQRLGQEVLALRKEVGELQQQLGSSNEALRRLRAAGLGEGAGAGGGLGGKPLPVIGSGVVVRTNALAVSTGGKGARGGGGTAGGGGGGSPTATAAAADDSLIAEQSQGDNATAGGGGAAAAATTGGAATGGSGGGVVDGDLAAAVARALKAELALAAAEQQLWSLKHHLAAAQSAATRQEREAEKLRERLGDKVAKEERRLARDKAVYMRLRQAAAVAKRDQNFRSAAGGYGWV